jgi:transcriptional regulator with XRE-family HTH domain
MRSLGAEPFQSTTQTLGTFLRSHRERLSPTELGLASAGRRRTPGLRREEVAQLCGVSTTWYTWLEQGRPIRASASVLKRIAETLQLSRAERLCDAYLFKPIDTGKLLATSVTFTSSSFRGG